MDAAGLGPFRDIPGNGDNFYQFTGIDKHAVHFKLKQQNGSWDLTEPQEIAWLKPGGTMLMLVLPNDKGGIDNGDNVFGNVTHCGDELCPDGFHALLYKCDNPKFGGNDDGFCDSKDALFGELRWLSGRPENPKLYTMDEISSHLSFDLRKGSFVFVPKGQQIEDEHGNDARFRGIVSLGWTKSGDGRVSNNRTIWDVWLLDDPIKDEDFDHHK
jgi:hypothetical protein